MERRAFLNLAGYAVASDYSFGARRSCSFDSDVEDRPDYRLVETIEHVDEVIAEREPSPDGRWMLAFVNFLTTPEGDRDVVLECTHSEPGFHVEGGVPYHTSLWAPSKHAASLMISFDSPTNVRVFRHIDRGKEVVLAASDSRKGRA